jgi:hypothetical protein
MLNQLSRASDAEWIQCSRPATRAPLSSKCATSAPASSVRTRSANPPNPAAPSAVIAASVPVATGAPSTSPSSSEARSTGRYWPTVR